MKVIKLDIDNNGGLYYIDFIPRIPFVEIIDYTYITVDSNLFTVDSISLTVDQTILTATSECLVNVEIINEFTKEKYYPLVELDNINSLFKLTFLETSFLREEGRYSITIKYNSDILYKGKMIFTFKNIQNYKYTTVTYNNKMKL